MGKKKWNNIWDLRMSTSNLVGGKMRFLFMSVRWKKKTTLEKTSTVEIK